MTADLLQAHPKTNIIFGQADALALGAAQAVKVANPDHRIWVAGFDGDTAALKDLKDGVFDVTATQQTQKMGRMGLDAAIALVKGEKLPAEQLQNATLTTKENVDRLHREPSVTPNGVGRRAFWRRPLLSRAATMTVPEQIATDRNAGGTLAARDRKEIWPDHRPQRRQTWTCGAGEVIALLGENGAGKSTIASIISGLVRPTIGSDDLARDRTMRPMRRPTRCPPASGSSIRKCDSCGTCRSPRTCSSGACPMRGGRVDREFMNRRAAEQLRRLGLDASPTTLVRDLRVAAQQQVEIAKALTLNARLLIFDEPTAALGAEETERLFEQIGRLKSEGVSFIYISHRLDEIARIADRVARPARRAARRDPRDRPGAGQDAGRGDGWPAARSDVPGNPSAAALGAADRGRRA